MRARDNPYRAERLHALGFRFLDATWELLLDRLGALGLRGCVTGPKGSGKTTLLVELAERLRRRGFQVERRGVRLDDPASREMAMAAVRQLAGRGVLILDGGDLLGRLQWRRLKALSRGRGLIVSSHGRRLLPVVHRCRSSVGLLEDLMRELHPVSDCPQPTPEELYARHRGNLREAMRELYDFHAALNGAMGCVGPGPAASPTEPEA